MRTSAARSGSRIVCVLLAAGGSRRLGAPKQLVRLGNRPLLARAADTARRAAPTAPLVVVLGAHALRLRALLRRTVPDARIAVNSHWQEGLAGSLRTGLGAAPRTAAAALVLLVDQPHIGARELRRVIGAWSRRPGVPAAASYAGRAGVPAIWPRRCWRALCRLEGDAGARGLLRGAGRLTLVSLPEAAVDIDAPADLARLRRGG